MLKQFSMNDFLTQEEIQHQINLKEINYSLKKSWFYKQRESFNYPLKPFSTMEMEED